MTDVKDSPEYKEAWKAGTMFMITALQEVVWDMAKDEDLSDESRKTAQYVLESVLRKVGIME